MQLDKDKIKDSLTEQDIHKILIDLGSKEPLQGNQYTTVCHGGEKHKLYYYPESNLFHCYTQCGCSYDIYELVIKAKKQQGYSLTFRQAVHYVASKTGKTFGYFKSDSPIANELITDWEWINRLKPKEKTNIILPEYDSRVLNVFMPYPHESWLAEGISYETMEKFNISYYFREERIILPHYDISGRLVGIRGRAMLDEDIAAGKKYMPVTVQNKLYNHSTMFNLYGIHKTKNAIKRLKKVALFEGEKSVYKCEDYYGDDNFSAATCSSTITKFQRDILLSLGIEEVIICFDKFREKKEDESEEQYQKKIEDYQNTLLKHARLFTPFVRTYIVWDDFDLLGYKDSPVDRGKQTLEQLMKTKYEIKTINEVY